MKCLMQIGGDDVCDDGLYAKSDDGLYAKSDDGLTPNATMGFSQFVMIVYVARVVSIV